MRKKDSLFKGIISVVICYFAIVLITYFIEPLLKTNKETIAEINNTHSIDCPECYEKGQENAFSQVVFGANDWDYYIKIEDLYDVLKSMYGDEADDMRDCIISDAETYTIEEMVNEIINNECSVGY